MNAVNKLLQVDGIGLTSAELSEESVATLKFFQAAFFKALMGDFGRHQQSAFLLEAQPVALQAPEVGTPARNTGEQLGTVEAKVQLTACRLVQGDLADELQGTEVVYLYAR